MAVLPSGRLIRAASQTKDRLAVKATSRVESMWKRQVLVAPGLAGTLASTSSGVRISTVLSLALARSNGSAARRSAHPADW